MKEDETNSNAKPGMEAWIEPELEARVVAWVAGEASAFEIAELERLSAEKPELAIFKRRIEAVHGLVAEAVKDDARPRRMSAERRARFLQALGETASPAGGQGEKSADVVTLPDQRKRPWWRAPQLYFTVSGVAAAGIVSMLSLSLGMFEPKEAEQSRRQVMMETRETASPSVPLNLPEAAEPKDGAAPVAAAPPAAREEYVTLSPFEIRKEPTFLERMKRAIMSERRESPAASSPTLPTRPASVETRIEGAAKGMADVVHEAPSTPPPPARDEIVKMDAFQVSAEPLPGGFMSSVSSSSMLMPPLPKPQFESGVTLGGVGGAVRPALTTDLTPPAVPAVSFDQTVTRGLAAATFPAERVPAEALTTAGGTLKLEAFSVSAEREGNARAIASPASPRQADGKPAVVPGSDKNQTSGGEVRFGSVVGGAPTGQKDPEVRTNQVAPFGPVASGAGAGNVFTRPSPDSMVIAGSDAALRGRLALSEGDLRDAAAIADKKRSDADDLPRARPAVPDTSDLLRAETSAVKQPESTFSLHVSDVSFRLTQAALARGEAPDASRIRPEEFYNAFDYGDPVPTMAEKVGARIEQAAHPFLQQRNLLRIAMKVPATGRGAAQPLALTVLLDTSGSMEREDRAASVQRALQSLISLLGPDDRITLVGFARQPRLLAEAVAGSQAAHLVDLARRTPREGGTNLEAALKLGADLARRHAAVGTQSRIVLLTDGAANLGNADPEQLARTIDTLRQQRIAFDACGVGLDGLDDAVLEALARRGDGRYYVLNSPDEADAGFARKLAGALRPAAENVKLQVRFNPARVGQYRLIGFEQHRLKAEDFRNDRVDAAELAAEEAAVAVYQVEALPHGSGEIGEVFVRFRDAASGQMVERSWAIAYDRSAPAFARAPASLQLAGTAALLAEKLRGGAPAAPIKLGELIPVMTSLRSAYPGQPRVLELSAMLAAARRLHPE